MNKKKRYILSLLAILLILVFGWREYQHYTDARSMKESYDSVISFNKVENDELRHTLGLKIADNVVMKQNLVSEKVAKEQFKKELKGYEDIIAYMKVEAVTRVGNIEANYDDSGEGQLDDISIIDENYIHKDDVSKNFIRTPKTFSYNDEWIDFRGTVSKKSTLIDSLSLFNKFDAVIGSKRSDKKFAWLRKRSPVVDLTSYNPYTKIVYVNNVTVDNGKSKVGNVLFSKPAILIYGIITGIAIK